MKLVVDKLDDSIHFIDSAANLLHVQYIAKHILDLAPGEIERTLDAFNHSVMRDPERRFYLATLGRFERDGGPVYALETTEVDTMGADLARDLYERVRRAVVDVPVLFKPANHTQEAFIATIPPDELPRVHAAELYASSPFVPLRPGRATGRLRVFRNEEEYRSTEPLRWFDIVVMDRVPEDIPRVSGILNSQHTTPLSHTNILARGWDIPNAVQLDVRDRLVDGAWVVYEVDPTRTSVALTPAEPVDTAAGPPRRAVAIPRADLAHGEITPLDRIDLADAVRYGTKAAHLGEVARVLRDGSDRLLGYYERPRPPRPNLLGHLARLLDEPRPDALADAANRLLRATLSVPPGIALPFGVATGPELAPRIADALARHVGPGPYVVRSSSNAEDLPGFSAAGIYESLTDVAVEDVPAAVERVRASLLGARASGLRAEAGIDGAHMAVIVQRQVSGTVGGVMVTANPVQPNDIRGVFLNISPRSVTDVVSGAALPIEHVYNTMEGGGRTLSLGAARSDVDESVKPLLARLALSGRLLQSHFSAEDQPVDVEWVADAERVHLVQIRPYGG